MAERYQQTDKRMTATHRKTPPTKRAPQQRRAIERIDAILAAAESVLAEDGYDGLTMVKIAAKAGITHTSIYHYFPSIEAILTTLISHLMDDFDAQVTANLAQADSPHSLIEAVLKSLQLGFDTYRSTPVARGLWAATRYLPTLRKIDDEDTARNALRFSERLLQLAPGCDPDATHLCMLLAGSLAVPTFETALGLPESLQERMLQEFLGMIRMRLKQVVMPAEQPGP